MQRKMKREIAKAFAAKKEELANSSSSKQKQKSLRQQIKDVGRNGRYSEEYSDMQER